MLRPNVQVWMLFPNGTCWAAHAKNAITLAGVQRMRSAWLGVSGNGIGAGEVHNGPPSDANLIGTTGAPSPATAAAGSNFVSWELRETLANDLPVASTWNFALPGAARTVLMNVPTSSLTGLPSPVPSGTVLILRWTLSCGPALADSLVPGTDGAVRLLRGSANFANRLITGSGSVAGTAAGKIRFWSSNPIDFDPLNPMIPVLRDPARAIYQSAYDLDVTFSASGDRNVTTDTFTYPVVSEVPAGFGTSWVLMESVPNFICWLQQDASQPRAATQQITWGWRFFGG